MSLSLVEIRPTPPDPKPTSYRFWERYRLEQLIAIRGHIETVIDDMSRQFGLFDPPAIAPEDPTVPPAAPDAKQNALGAMLSPSQVKTFLDCSARWWFKYGAGLIDPAGGSLVRGRVVHKMCERFMRAKLDGAPISADDLAEPFEEAWDRESNLASFHNDDDVELLKRQAGLDTLVIAYKGGGPMLNDIMGGQIQLIADPMLSSLPLAKAKKMKALAITSLKRVPAAPEIPTVEESGMTGFEFVSWYGLWGPKDMPADLVARIQAQAVKVLAQPDVKQRMGILGFEPIGSTPDEFARYIDKEMAIYAKIIKDANIKTE